MQSHCSRAPQVADGAVRPYTWRGSLSLSHHPVRTFLLAVCLLSSAHAVAKPRLVPISDAVLITAQSSYPFSLMRAGAQVFFTANDGVHGLEPWRSDGTANGTSVIDIYPGAQTSGPQLVGALGNVILFYASDGV